MMTLEVKSPAHGAAYQVVYGRVQPVHCVTRARQAEIVAEMQEIVVWAATQSPEISDAYRWATQHIAGELERHMGMNEMGSAVQQKLRTFPRPPVKSDG